MAEILILAGTFAAGFVLAAITTAAKSSELERRLRLALRSLRTIAREDPGRSGDAAMRALGTDLELTTALSKKVTDDALD